MMTSRTDNEVMKSMSGPMIVQSIISMSAEHKLSTAKTSLNIIHYEIYYRRKSVAERHKVSKFSRALRRVALDKYTLIEQVSQLGHIFEITMCTHRNSSKGRGSS